MKHLFFLILLFISGYTYGQSHLKMNGSNTLLTSNIEYLEDKTHNLTIDSVCKAGDFHLLEQKGVPNFNITKSAIWLRIKLVNDSAQQSYMLRVSNPLLDTVEFYVKTAQDRIRYVKTGQAYSFFKRQYLSSDYLFSFDAPQFVEKEVYIKVTNSGALIVPISVGTEKTILESDKYKDIFWGIYIGVMLAMLFYNCFVYITTKDTSYLYYILYVIAVIITQITVSGYGFQLLWPVGGKVALYSTFFTPPLVGLAGMQFMRHFLKTRKFLPKADKFLAIFGFTYGFGVVCCLAGDFKLGFPFVDLSASTLSIYMLVMTAVISRQGYRPARFFLISWIVFLVGVVIFILKNLNVLPYNNFTVFTMPVGSAMEVVLLSFALADRINILKKEKEESQAQTLKALQENERIVKEQNVMLEKKVTERTLELKLSNDGLNKALKELKEAETQLVEQEKMASLGQLTAGIAHEINNPINFVTSNVKPLNRDVRILIDAVNTLAEMVKTSVPDSQQELDNYLMDIDYEYLKEEIEQLLNGISDGAGRTAEIVKGLRIFSRLDEDDLKKANINDGMDSTLVITNNLLNNSIVVKKEYALLPLVECYPGKLNQVFLNMISNAIYAIRKKFEEKEGGILTIKTNFDENNVYISIADNGIGMDEATKKRLFEPFFTTKDVGEGTGLGLSIAYNTINKHNGSIQINSAPGVGTEFIITLPLVQL